MLPSLATTGLPYILALIFRSTESISMIYWLLAREIRILRGEQKYNEEWDIVVDLFYYRTVDLNENKKVDQ